MLANFLLLFFTIFQKEFVIEFEYVLPTNGIPLNIYWISQDNVLLSYFSHSEIFNLENRERNILEECKNCIYGYDREILKCKYEHHTIKSIEEFSTSIYLYNSNDELIFSKDLLPTVVPVVCKKKYIILKNAYPFLEKNTFLLDVEEGKEREISKGKDFYIRGLPEFQNISIGEERIILLTRDNLLKVYKIY